MKICPIKSPSKIKHFPLHLAAQIGRAKIAKMLIRNGADVNELNSEGLPPIFNTTPQGTFSII